MANPTPADRLAQALCPDRSSGAPCDVPCDACRRDSAAVAQELAAILGEHHSVSSKDAAEEVLFLIAPPAQGTVQTVQEKNHG